MKGNQIIRGAQPLHQVVERTFYCGMKYQQGKTSQFTRGNVPHNVKQVGQKTDGANVVRGEIIKKDEESITIKLNDDSSKLVLISQNTTVNKAEQGSADDLIEGQQVMVFGKDNSDGSVTASQIQLNFMAGERDFQGK